MRRRIKFIAMASGKSNYYRKIFEIYVRIRSKVHDFNWTKVKVASLINLLYFIP